MKDAEYPQVDAEKAWQAVLQRDPASDGRFIFAVLTTGVYCRPTCPARRPLRQNVRFFSSPDAAEAEGFRACRRCRPRHLQPDPSRQMAEQARAYLEDHLDENVTLGELAREVGVSLWHLQRTFKKFFGQSPKSYVNFRRLEAVRTGLRKEPDVTTAIFEAGFTDSSQLYSQSDVQLGMTPGAWRKGGEGVQVHFATADSPVGRILVAGSDRGLCAVLLGDDDADLEAALRQELPRAEIRRGGPKLESWVEEVLRRVSGEAPVRPLPIDTPSTDFQRRVWQALTEIPRGETRSYSEVAAHIGQPRASRAVASACAANRLAVVVPCHRVVKASGDPGDYRWGRERKRLLLVEETR